jgi:hypothetical protein
MDSFEAYKTYVAIKNHFTSKTYDYFKYNGSTKASRATFEKRNDKFFFNRLAKHRDIVGYLVANFVYGNKVSWVGDFLNSEASEQCYLKYLKNKESLTYIYKEDLNRLDVEFNDNFICVNGQHPKLLRMYLQGEVNIETLVILDDLLSFSRKWTRRIEEKIIWPQVNNLYKKYKPFIQYDKEKLRTITVDYFS